jgi:hypothetical protein
MVSCPGGASSAGWTAVTTGERAVAGGSTGAGGGTGVGAGAGAGVGAPVEGAADGLPPPPPPQEDNSTDKEVINTTPIWRVRVGGSSRLRIRCGLSRREGRSRRGRLHAAHRQRVELPGSHPPAVQSQAIAQEIGGGGRRLDRRRPLTSNRKGMQFGELAPGVVGQAAPPPPVTPRSRLIGCDGGLT